jgi:hypothetical protein
MTNAYKRICEKIEEMEKNGIVKFNEIANTKKKYTSLYKEYKARKDWFYDMLSASGITVTEENCMSDFSAKIYNKEEQDVLRIVSFIKRKD